MMDTFSAERMLSWINCIKYFCIKILLIKIIFSHPNSNKVQNFAHGMIAVLLALWYVQHVLESDNE